MNTLITPLPLKALSVGAPGAGRGAFAWLTRTGASLWRTLEHVGRARARHELLELAARYEATQPSLASELRAACAYDPRVEADAR
jgi:hypothetical protein